MGLWCGSGALRSFVAEVVGPDLVVHGGIGVVAGGHGLQLFHGEVSACVEGFQSTVGVDGDAIETVC